MWRCLTSVTNQMPHSPKRPIHFASRTVSVNTHFSALYSDLDESPMGTLTSAVNQCSPTWTPIILSATLVPAEISGVITITAVLVKD